MPWEKVPGGRDHAAGDTKSQCLAAGPGWGGSPCRHQNGTLLPPTSDTLLLVSIHQLSAFKKIIIYAISRAIKKKNKIKAATENEVLPP